VNAAEELHLAAAGMRHACPWGQGYAAWFDGILSPCGRRKGTASDAEVRHALDVARAWNRSRA
jgi:hypothetical protein